MVVLTLIKSVNFKAVEMIVLIVIVVILSIIVVVGGAAFAFGWATCGKRNVPSDNTPKGYICFTFINFELI